MNVTKNAAINWLRCCYWCIRPDVKNGEADDALTKSLAVRSILFSCLFARLLLVSFPGCVSISRSLSLFLSLYLLPVFFFSLVSLSLVLVSLA